MIDPAEVSGWFKAQAAPLVLYARQWLTPAAAEDIVQEAFVRLLLQRKLPDHPKAWLYRAVRNGAISHWRKVRRQEARDRAGAFHELWFEPEDESLDAEMAQSAMQQLPLPQREVLVLRIWAQMKLREIAELLGLPVSTAFHHYREGLASLRQQMGVPCKSNRT